MKENRNYPQNQNRGSTPNGATNQNNANTRLQSPAQQSSQAQYPNQPRQSPSGGTISFAEKLKSQDHKPAMDTKKNDQRKAISDLHNFHATFHLKQSDKAEPPKKTPQRQSSQDQGKRRTSPPPGVKSPPTQSQPILQTPPVAVPVPKVPISEKPVPSQPPGLAQPVHQKEIPSGPTSPVSAATVQPDQVRSPPAQQKEAENKITQSKLNVNAKEFTPFAPKVQTGPQPVPQQQQQQQQQHQPNQPMQTMQPVHNLPQSPPAGVDQRGMQPSPHIPQQYPQIRVQKSIF